MKEQAKVMARDLIETDISRMPDRKFKATIIRILTGLEERMEDFREAFTAYIKKFKKIS